MKGPLAPGLGFIGNYTTQLSRDSNKPLLRIYILNNQDSMESKAGFFDRGSTGYNPKPPCWKKYCKR